MPLDGQMSVSGSDAGTRNVHVSGNKDQTYPWLKSYPENVDWHAEIAVRSMPDLFDTAVAQYHDNPCTRFLGKAMSYGEMGDLTERVAAGLHANGLKPGDKIGLLLPNCPFFIAFYHAALKLGCVVVNFNPLYTVEELEHQVRDSETVVMVSLDLKILFNKVEALIAGETLKQAIICPFADMLPLR